MNCEISKTDCGERMTQEESRKVQLDMLDALANFCDEHNLRYFLSGGTLLGAIRHKGFIPWDDDIDVNIPRPDCEKLFQLTRGKLGKFRLAGPDKGEYMDSCNFYRIYNDETIIEDYKGGKEDKHPYYHPIFVDIFPIEGLPNNKIRCYFHWGEIIFLHKMRHASSLNQRVPQNSWRFILRSIIKGPAKMIGYNNWGKAILRCSRRYSFDNSSYVGVTTTPTHLTRERVCKDDYLKTVKVSFEGKEYNAPGNYDTYLRQLYGDYMKLPPVEEQKSQHTFNMYWKAQK